LITEALAFRPQGRGTDLAIALRDIARLLRRRAVVFVVSDFLAEGYEAPLAVCARRHDVIPVVVSDPVEDELPAAGLSGLWPVAARRKRGCRRCSSPPPPRSRSPSAPSWTGPR